MVVLENAAVLEQQNAACGLPGTAREHRPSQCPATGDVDDVRICLVVLCALFGILCLLLL
uniref:BNLF2a-like protein n=1 Tax=gorilline gammaherpesvirus 1 TaxID=159604 RepID=A2TJU3_9GAMA|nr:BNLF2a-like protein [gorilline gammaherpesvirus 1]